jgi:hypothetical protein
MRGIVELEVLRAIEKSLGGNLRIQNFFDLIIGTRYVNCIMPMWLTDTS